MCSNTAVSGQAAVRRCRIQPLAQRLLCDCGSSREMLCRKRLPRLHSAGDDSPYQMVSQACQSQQLQEQRHVYARGCHEDRAKLHLKL